MVSLAFNVKSPNYCVFTKFNGIYQCWHSGEMCIVRCVNSRLCAEGGGEKPCLWEVNLMHFFKFCALSDFLGGIWNSLIARL